MTLIDAYRTLRIEMERIDFRSGQNEQWSALSTVASAIELDIRANHPELVHVLDILKDFWSFEPC